MSLVSCLNVVAAGWQDVSVNKYDTVTGGYDLPIISTTGSTYVCMSTEYIVYCIHFCQFYSCKI